MRVSTEAAAPPRILVVAEGDADARAVASTLAELGSIDAHGCIAGDADAPRADVVVLAFASLEACRRHASALRPAAADGVGQTATAPTLVLRCGADDAGAAARCVRDGLVDDYAVASGPAAEADPDRLLTAVFGARRLSASLAAAPAGRATRTRPLVFVVEDDVFTRELVSASLGYDELDLAFEGDGSLALQRIRETRPDLVLMDVMLPGRDGVTLTQMLKSDQALRGIPIVMLTGEARRDIIKRSLDAGAADFVVKPFLPDALRGKIAKYLPAPA